MLGLIVHWEPAVAVASSAAARNKLLGWTTLTAKAFGADRVAIVDVDGTGLQCRDEELDCRVVASLGEALTLFDDATPVYVEHGGAPLRKFSHPRSAVYVLGSDYGQLVVPSGAAHVSIETARAGLGLYSHVAAAIVLHARGSA